MALPSRP